MKTKEQKPRATELEYLKWFRLNADFGVDCMQDQFIRKTGKNIPKGWNFYSDGETSTDVK